jgi:hypothetical protein
VAGLDHCYPVLFCVQERPDVTLADVVGLVCELIAIPRVRDARHFMPADGSALALPDGDIPTPSGSGSVSGASQSGPAKVDIGDFVGATVEEEEDEGKAGDEDGEDGSRSARWDPSQAIPSLEVDGPTHVANTAIVGLPEPYKVAPALLAMLSETERFALVRHLGACVRVYVPSPALHAMHHNRIAHLPPLYPRLCSRH